MENIKFENVDFLYGLLLIPILIFLYLILNYRNKRIINKHSDSHLIKQMVPGLSYYRKHLKFIIHLLILILLIFAIANPQSGTKLETVKRKGVDILIALDVSNSMLAKDVQPNRLQSAKQAISRLIDELNGDKIGLIVFGGKSYMQLPITTDYAAAKMLLSSVNTGMIPTQGTSISNAMIMAEETFKKMSEKTEKGQKNKVMIIITDGEDHDENAIELAENLNSQGVSIFTVGIGKPQGAPIPINKDGTEFKKDIDGNTVITKLNEQLLQDIANKADGEYFRAVNTQTCLEGIMNRLNKLQKVETDSKIYTDYEDRFQFFLFPALLLLLIEILLSEKKSRTSYIFEKFNN